MLKDFVTLASPREVKKILNANKNFLLTSDAHIKKVVVSVIQSYRDERSYNLAAHYSLTLVGPGGKERKKSIFALSHSDGRKEYAHRAGRIVFNAFNDMRQGVSVPRPYMYIKRYNLVLLEYIPGKTFVKIIKKEENVKKRYIVLLMRWLSHFQKIPINSKIKTSISFYHLEHNIKVLKERGHKEAAMIDNKFKVIKNKILRWSKQHAFVMVHGDFNPSNIMISKNKLTVIDFENVYSGDSLIDAANMFAYITTILKNAGASITRQSRAQKTFMEEYAKSRGGLSGEEKKRFSTYVDYFLLLFKTHPMVWGNL